MTKRDFLIQLQRTLGGRLESAKIAGHTAYYEEYIEIQVRKGSDEEKVIEALGAPELIAKSILNAEYDSKPHLNEATFYSLGTRLKSVCGDLGEKIGRKARDWFNRLK